MSAVKAHRLATKSALQRRAIPPRPAAQVPRSPSPPSPPPAFGRRVPVKSRYEAQPLIAPKTYMTVYEFPSIRPKAIYPYPSSFLRSPMRRDILYRAVVYEDNAARGTGGHTKTRGEVRGSTRKIRPQKGSGRARLGSIRSPMLIGGGVAHGPRRRSFATKIQRKVYALAYRTAISYRFGNNQVMLTTPQFLEHGKTKLLLTLIRQLKWTRKAIGGVLFVPLRERKHLEMAARSLGADVTVKRVREVRVKDLLLRGRVVFERKAFEWLIQKYGLDKLPRPKQDPMKKYRKLMELL